MQYENVNTPEELLEFMDSIEYGFISDEGEKFSGDNPEEFSENIMFWHLSSPERLLKTRIGHCFDQVELERLWFKSHGYIFKTFLTIFMIEEKNDYPTHTFLAYEDNSKWKLFEHADYFNRGICEYATLEELIEVVKKRQILFAEVSDDIGKKLGVFEYDTPEYGIGFQEFIDYVVDSGEIA